MADLTTGVVATFSRSALTRLLRALPLVLASASAIALADETNPDDDPMTILSAAQQTCESLRSGHFTMTGVLRTPEPNWPGVKEAGGEPAAEAVIKQVFEYWFDSERDRWRIDLAPDPSRYHFKLGYSWSKSPEGVQVATWKDFEGGMRLKDVYHGASRENTDRMTAQHITFRVQSLPRMRSRPFFLVNHRLDSPWKTPEECFTSRLGAKDYVVKSSDNDRVVLYRRAPLKLSGAEGAYTENEWTFVRKASLLPTRYVLSVAYPNLETEGPVAEPVNRVESETEIEWTQLQNGVYVPTRFRGRDIVPTGTDLGYSTCDFDLNWVSVNEPIGAEVFNILELALRDEKASLRRVQDLDTDTGYEPRFAEREARQSMFARRAAEIKATRIGSSIGAAILAIAIVVGVVWYCRKTSHVGAGKHS